MAMKLEGKHAVVTGAGTGIGRAIALAFAAEGAKVMVNYRGSAEAAQDCVDSIRGVGGEARACRADVTDPQQVSALVASATEAFGSIEIWANIAGADILTGHGASDSDTAKLSRLLEVDLRGTILCSWAAAPLMRPGSVILNMSWDLALEGMAGRNPEMFAAAKAGVTGFTRSLARSLAPDIRVNELAPGWIETEFASHDMSAAYRAAVVAQTPLARFGQPADVAAAAVFLVSDDAAFITGQTLKINGGLSS